MKIYWVDVPRVKSLAIVPRPRGGDWLADELISLKRDGIDVLISLLTPDEQDELGLMAERDACESADVRFMPFPIPDRQVPQSGQDFLIFLGEVRQLLGDGYSIGAHCRAGIGRSSLMIAALLCTEGMSADEAFRRLSEARGLQVPDTPEQIAWIQRLSSP